MLTKLFSNVCSEKYNICDVKDLVEKADEIDVSLPSLPQLKEIITKASNWLEKVTHFQPPNVPFLDDLIAVVDTGEVLPIYFEHLKALQSQIAAANIWRENCMKVFLKKSSTIELIEVGLEFLQACCLRC